MVEGTGFENQQWAQAQPGFKSLSLRQSRLIRTLYVYHNGFGVTFRMDSSNKAIKIPNDK